LALKFTVFGCASKNADTVVAPNLKYCFEYDELRKKRCPGEFDEKPIVGLFGSLTIGLLVQEPEAIEPGSTVFLASP